MDGEWRLSTWGDEVSLEYGKALRAYKDKGKYRVFGSNGPIGWTSQPLAKGPGVILGRKGAYRGVQYSPEPFHVIDTAYYVVPKSEMNMRWLYYAIIFNKLGDVDDGSPIPSTTRAAVNVMEMVVPPLPEQHRIADILGSLDDKIELNRKMNETLEAMARALFKSWFVDFDPVVAKSEGRQPEGMDAETAKLFPSSFEDSEIGRIPKGWKVGVFGDIASSRRSIIGVGEFPLGTAYIGLEHMPRRSIALSEWGDASSVESAKSQFSRGDVLFGKLRPYFHKVGIAPVDGICSTDILVIVPRKAEWSAFVLGHASSDELVDFADGCSTGTRMPRVSWGDLSRYSIPIPPYELAGLFTQLVTPFIDAIVANTHESRALVSTRDSLLPRLLSGELTVSTRRLA